MGHCEKGTIKNGKSASVFDIAISILVHQVPNPRSFRCMVGRIVNELNIVVDKNGGKKAVIALHVCGKNAIGSLPFFLRELRKNNDGQNKERSEKSKRIVFYSAHTL